MESAPVQRWTSQLNWGLSPNYPGPLQNLPGQARRVPSKDRQFLVNSNVRRHVPIWVEFKKSDAITEHRRSVIGLADNDCHTFFDFARVYATQFEASYVHDQILLPQVLRHPSQTLHSQNDATDALLYRYVHGYNCRRSDDSVCIEALTDLKAFDRFDQRIAVELRLRCTDFVAGAVGYRKSRTNGRYTRVGHARPNRLSQWDRPPATFSGKCPIFCEHRAKCSIALAWRLPRIEKAINAIGLRKILKC